MWQERGRRACIVLKIQKEEQCYVVERENEKRLRRALRNTHRSTEREHTIWCRAKWGVKGKPDTWQYRTNTVIKEPFCN